MATKPVSVTGNGYGQRIKRRQPLPFINETGIVTLTERRRSSIQSLYTSLDTSFDNEKRHFQFNETGIVTVALDEALIF
jgi:hypothetical protein